MKYSHLQGFPVQGKQTSSAKSIWGMAVNKKVMQKQGGGMGADGQAQPSSYKTVH